MFLNNTVFVLNKIAFDLWVFTSAQKEEAQVYTSSHFDKTIRNAIKDDNKVYEFSGEDNFFDSIKSMKCIK